MSRVFQERTKRTQFAVSCTATLYYASYGFPACAGMTEDRRNDKVEVDRRSAVRRQVNKKPDMLYAERVSGFSTARGGLGATTYDSFPTALFDKSTEKTQNNGASAAHKKQVLNYAS